MFICGIKFIMIKLYRSKGWQKLKRYSCVTHSVWKLSNIFTIATKTSKKSKHHNEKPNTTLSFEIYTLLLYMFIDLNISNLCFCFVNSCHSPSYLLRQYLNSRKDIVVSKIIRILRFSYNKKDRCRQHGMINLGNEWILKKYVLVTGDLLF